MAFFSATADRSLKKIEELTKQIEAIDVTKEDDSRKGQKHYFCMYQRVRKDEYLRRLAYVDGFQGLVFFNQLSELGAMEEKFAF